MFKIRMLLAAGLALSPALALAKAHSHGAEHGGQVQKIGPYEAELVVKGTDAMLYVLDDKDKKDKNDNKDKSDDDEEDSCSGNDDEDADGLIAPSSTLANTSLAEEPGIVLKAKKKAKKDTKDSKDKKDKDDNKDESDDDEGTDECSGSGGNGAAGATSPATTSPATTSTAVLPMTEVTGTSAGGDSTIALADERVVLRIFPWMPSGITFKLRFLDPATVSAPPGKRAGSMVFRIEAQDASGTTLEVLPAEVNLSARYAERDVSGSSEQGVMLSRLNPVDNQWKAAPKLVRATDNNYVAASIMEPGVYAIHIP